MENKELVKRLRTEDEIMAGWAGQTQPRISIRCLVYNHEAYIEDAIQGFLIQKTTVPFEICLHDDASTDASAAIVRRYQQAYPRLIKVIYQSKNQYSQGISPGLVLSALCSGDYYAICEGDDYWTDPNKLQLQFEALEQHPGVDMCIHPAIKRWADKDKSELIGCYRASSGLVAPAVIIEKAHGQIPTASTFIRAAAFNAYAQFRRQHPGLRVGDIYMHFFGAIGDGVYYLARTMSCYRVYTPQSYTQRAAGNPQLRLLNLQVRIDSYRQLDRYTDYRFSAPLNRSSRQMLKEFLCHPNNPRGYRLQALQAYGDSLGWVRGRLYYAVGTAAYFAWRGLCAMGLLRKRQG